MGFLAKKSENNAIPFYFKSSEKWLNYSIYLIKSLIINMFLLFTSLYISPAMVIQEAKFFFSPS